jgi:hypothetical protein
VSVIVGIDIKYAREVALRFEQFPEAARTRLVERVEALTERLKGLVEEAIPRRTGRSARVRRTGPSLSARVETKMRMGENYVRGTVKLDGDWAKAAALEYGSHREIEVAERVRARLFRPTLQVAAAYTRKTNIDPEDYLRGPLASIADEALAELKQAMEEAVADGT